MSFLKYGFQIQITCNFVKLEYHFVVRQWRFYIRYIKAESKSTQYADLVIDSDKTFEDKQLQNLNFLNNKT